MSYAIYVAVIKVFKCENMKKIFTLIMAAALVSGVASARDKITTDVNELPESARTLLSQYYHGAGVSRIKIDSKISGQSDYEVVLDDGTEIEFAHDGSLKEIESGRDGVVPENLILKSIRDYVSTNYVGRKIVSMDVERNGYDIELSDGVELKFNKSGKVLSVEDWMAGTYQNNKNAVEFSTAFFVGSLYIGSGTVVGLES